MNEQNLRVPYLELRQPPVPASARDGRERVAVERLDPERYLALYRCVGGPVLWDQRLRMPPEDLAALLRSPQHSLYVLRDGGGEALGLCEFDRSGFPDIELKNFGLVPGAQGRGLGPWLLATALGGEWRAGASRIWLHTDTWDHPAAVPVYLRAGFQVYAVREEAADGL
jgi:GNAT superfamily N-acetyltransferase